MSFTTSATTFRMPFRAASGVRASQLRLGNSAHNPTYSLSSPDQVTRYVNLSFASAMVDLQFFNSQKHLFYLICLGLSFVILNINPRVTLPGCPVYIVTASLVARFTKMMFTYFAQIDESDILRRETRPFDRTRHSGFHDLADLNCSFKKSSSGPSTGRHLGCRATPFFHTSSTASNFCGMRFLAFSPYTVSG